MSLHPPELTADVTGTLPPFAPAGSSPAYDEDIRLHFAVQLLGAVEAQLLDQHRYTDCLALLAEDLHRGSHHQQADEGLHQ
ncbi:hypothetical protein [Streptomyces sp. 2A115]|uniref:hypothetical protein n=1 Tax=Streptomyces sp. 2A115 TaxID=3457439 RepID=UPI003FD63522